VRLVAVADTHNKHAELAVPDGDLFVHAGDLTLHGSLEELMDALAWIGRLPHEHKVVVAGNHDRAFQRDPVAARALLPPGVTYLEGTGAKVAGLRVWGGPWTPRYRRTLWAFELSLEERGARWATIPAETELLVTHIPAAGILDTSDRHQRAGCAALVARLPQLARLRAHVAGHLHEGRGHVLRHGVHHLNVAAMERGYRGPLSSALMVDL
jgi:predicted phosphohydrolase